MKKSTKSTPLEIEEGRGENREWDFQFLRAVPKGPYKSQAEKYAAVSKYEDYCQVAEREGFGRPSDVRVRRHMGLTPTELKSIVMSLQYKEMRMAGAKVTLGAALADMAPMMKEHLHKLITGAKDNKEKKDALELALKLAEKYGLYDIDINKTNVGEDLDTDVCIEECLDIIEKLVGERIVVQKFCKAVKDGANSSDKRERGDDGEVIHDDKAVEDGGGNGPDGVVEAASAPSEVVEKPEEVPDDDRGEQVGQDGLVNG